MGINISVYGLFFSCWFLEIALLGLFFQKKVSVLRDSFQLLISRVWVLRVAIQKKLGFGFKDFSFGIDL